MKKSRKRLARKTGGGNGVGYYPFTNIPYKQQLNEQIRHVMQRFLRPVKFHTDVSTINVCNSGLESD
jgi:hypothetical protein